MKSQNDHLYGIQPRISSSFSWVVLPRRRFGDGCEVDRGLEGGLGEPGERHRFEGLGGAKFKVLRPSIKLLVFCKLHIAVNTELCWMYNDDSLICHEHQNHISRTFPCMMHPVIIWEPEPMARYAPPLSLFSRILSVPKSLH